MTTEKYEYRGHDFEVAKPEACVMKVSNGRHTATVSIHKATNQFRGSLDGWGSNHTTIEKALDAACKRILEKSASPTEKELCSEMDEFYSSLSK